MNLIQKVKLLSILLLVLLISLKFEIAFAATVPIQVAPSSGATITKSSVTMEWTTGSGSSWPLQVRKTSGTSVYNGTITGSTNYTLSNLENGSYEWRVSACDSSCSSWTSWIPYTISVSSCSVSTPSQSSPVDGAIVTDSTVVLDWSSGGGTSWPLQVLTNSGSSVYNGTVTGSSNYTLAGLSNGTYKWRVSSYDGGSCTSSWSSYRYFTVNININNISVSHFSSSPQTADPGATVTVTGRIINEGSTAVSNLEGIIFVQSDFRDGKTFVLGRSIPRVKLFTGTIDPGDYEEFSFPLVIPEVLDQGWDYFVVINMKQLTNETNTVDNNQFAPILASNNNRGRNLGKIGCSPSAGDPVNTALGNFTYDAVDLQYPGIGSPFRFQRFYNSQGGLDSPMGVYWNHSYNIFLHEDTIDSSKNGNVTVVYGDGKRHKYIKNSDNSYTPPLGVSRILEKNQATGTFTITEKNLKKYHFTADGKLASIEDRFGNTLGFTYTNNNLTQVTDTSGRQITFTYQLIADKNRIITIRGPLLPNMGSGIRQAITYSYDSLGNLISATDPNGNTTHYDYSGTHDDKHLMTKVINGRGNTVVTNTYGNANGTSNDHGYYVVKQVYADNGETSFVYDLSQKDTSVTGTDGLLRRQYYDDYYRITKETDPNGYSFVYHYNTSGDRDWVEDKRGNRTTYAYDQWHNLTLETGPDNVATYYEYTSHNDVKKKVEAYGQFNYTWDFAYDDEEKLLISVTDPEGYTTSYTYNSYGQKITETDPEQNETTYTYGDSWGNLTATLDAEGNNHTYEYDARGLQIRKVDSLGYWTEYHYDLNGNLLQEVNQQGTVFSEYDADNNLTARIDRKNNRTTYGYDTKDRLETTTDPLERTSTTVYDTSDRKIQTADVWGNISSFTYTHAGNLETVTNADDITTTYTYDPDGNRTLTIDGAGKQWKATYDARNRLLSETAPLQNTKSYGYDLLGRILSSTDAEGNSTQFTYDKRGLLKTVTDPEGGQSFFTYDGNGSRLSERDALGNTIRYAYDGLKRLLSITDRNAKQSILTYYGDTQLFATKTNGNGETANFQLYPDRPLIKYIQYPGTMGTATYNHDANGNLLSMDDSVGQTTYQYDALDRITSVQDPFGKTVGYQYGYPSHDKTLVYPNLNEVVYHFDAMHRLQTVTDWTGFNTTYGYDNRGLLTSIVNTTGTRTDYSYDDASRLLSKTDRASSNSVISSFNYVLDPLGNRTEATMDVPLAPEFHEKDDEANYDPENQIQSWNTNNYSFDYSGRLTESENASETLSFGFRFDDRLTSLTSSLGTWTYSYNGLGNRLSVAFGGNVKRYVLDLNDEMDHILAEADANGTINATYIYGTGLLYRIDPDGSRHFFHFDPLGSTIALTDDTETITDAYAYDIYGELANRQGTDNNPFLYIGQYGVMQEDNGLLYMRARYYDPETSRFLSRDPVKGDDKDTLGMNPYLYGGGDPIVMIDPKGEKGELWEDLKKRNNNWRIFWKELGETIKYKVKPYVTLGKVRNPLSGISNYEANEGWAKNANSEKQNAVVLGEVLTKNNEATGTPGNIKDAYIDTKNKIEEGTEAQQFLKVVGRPTGLRNVGEDIGDEIIGQKADAAEEQIKRCECD